MPDIYANLATVKDTAVDSTLGFTELLTGINLSQGKGLLIDRLEYHFSGNIIADPDASGEYITLGLSTSNTITSFGVNQKSMIDEISIFRVDLGAAATGIYFESPKIHEFLPPIIVAAPRLYFMSLAADAISGQAMLRIFFRYVDLKPQEYLEIAESFVLVG